MYISFWFIVIGGIILFIYLRNKEKKQDAVTKNMAPENDIEEETVFEVQTNFEKKLQDTFLPDAIRGKEMYIYKNIMRPWYDKLSGKYRYDKEMIQKLRNDWMDYIKALEDERTYSYLASEAEEGKKREHYEDEREIAGKKILAIEEAFSSAVGDGAIELSKIRALDLFSSFNSKGEIAPDGFEFDLNEKLRPQSAGSEE